MLLVGPDHLVGKLVDFLVAEPPPYAPLRRIDAWRAVQPASRASDTVVVRHVDRLTLPEQRRMLEWLASKDRRTQVVSTASAPLLPLVESGAFNDSLYYRLNMVYVDLSD